jgi:aminoglycoside 6-adenylyltransferase
MIAKAVVRDEPWAAKVRDADLKAELLRLLEWDHCLRHGGARDVRHVGSGMRTWMDVDIQQRLDHCWAGFSVAETERALTSTLGLFGEVATRVAGLAGLVMHDLGSVRAEVDSILGWRNSR